ncbi:hypothetical protein FH972_023537 [Carpinus fangiana]|uniref:non-specific serine/threonine protein kinase n=1 Tax=Carpinus fangiana TaxID=176857 RepID=A0A5N6KVG0_9ROSI|nr:hypothetical protein FH972_023537 [Carpinus fangiana]
MKLERCQHSRAVGLRSIDMRHRPMLQSLDKAAEHSLEAALMKTCEKGPRQRTRHPWHFASCAKQGLATRVPKTVRRRRSFKGGGGGDAASTTAKPPDAQRRHQSGPGPGCGFCAKATAARPPPQRALDFSLDGRLCDPPRPFALSRASCEQAPAMDDLSLSQSYGGLRIANPDDDDSAAGRDVNSPVQSPGSQLREPPHHNVSPPAVPPAAAQQAAAIAHASHPPDAEPLNFSALGFDPTSYSHSSHLNPPGPAAAGPDYAQQPRLVHRQSMPLTDYQQQAYAAQGRERPYYPYSNRPTSGLYNHPNMSTGSGSTTESSYQRVRSESSQSAATVGGVRRSASRAAAAAAMSSSNPARVPSARQYPAAQSPAASAPTSSYPPRRSSRATNASQEGQPQQPQSQQQQQPAAPTTSRSGSYTTPSSSSYTTENLPQTSEEWQDRGAAQSIQRTVDSNGKPATKVVKKGVRDFVFGRTLGEGSYSQVLAATDRTTNREYAIKILDKKHIIKEKKVKYVNIEKDTLNRLTDHPGVVRLYYTFQDERSLYFVIDVAPNGELLGVLKKYSSFDEECSKFYGAEILDAIEYMHSRGIIHRDLKPENVLLDEQLHVKITDFGTAKILDLSKQDQFGSVSVRNDPMDGADTDRAVSFVGTAEYVSPELLTDKNACKASDLWAFGCIIYQLIAGRPPFKAPNEYLTFQKIVKLEYAFPDGFPHIARDLVMKLLVLDPKERLPIEGIKAHPFFSGIEWGKGLWKQKPPKLRPYRPHQRDAALAATRAQESYPGTSNMSKPSVQKPVLPHSSSGPTSASRPQPRVITELAPPTQLDIDWSPVLTRPNERVLKLGQLTVYSMPAPYSPTGRTQGGDQPSEAPSKFSRFFGASTTKKRTRLVMISSGARLIIAPSGGDKKEAKTVVDLADKEVTWKTQLDGKGYMVWKQRAIDRRVGGMHNERQGARGVTEHGFIILGRLKSSSRVFVATTGLVHHDGFFFAFGRPGRPPFLLPFILRSSVFLALRQPPPSTTGGRACMSRGVAKQQKHHDSSADMFNLHGGAATIGFSLAAADRHPFSSRTNVSLCFAQDTVVLHLRDNKRKNETAATMPLTIDTLLYSIYTTLLNPLLCTILTLSLAARSPTWSFAPLHAALVYTALVFALRILLALDSRGYFLSGDQQTTPRTLDWPREVVLVTGGCGGLGGLIAELYALRGVRVAVVDVLPETPERVEEWEAKGGAYFRCDVGDADAVAALRSRVEVAVRFFFSLVLCPLSSSAPSTSPLPPLFFHEVELQPSHETAVQRTSLTNNTARPTNSPHQRRGHHRPWPPRAHLPRDYRARIRHEPARTRVCAQHVPAGDAGGPRRRDRGDRGVGTGAAGRGGDRAVCIGEGGARGAALADPHGIGAAGAVDDAVVCGGRAAEFVLWAGRRGAGAGAAGGREGGCGDGWGGGGAIVCAVDCLVSGAAAGAAGVGQGVVGVGSGCLGWACAEAEG